MIVECKDERESTVDLGDPVCRAAILQNLSKEFGIEEIVLSHYTEKKNGKVSVDALYSLLNLCQLMDRMGAREPRPNFPQLSRRQLKAKCSACPFNPHNLFASLRSRAEGNFVAFIEEFTGIVEGIYRFREAGCRRCVESTIEDLVFLYNESERLSRKLAAMRPQSSLKEA